MRRWIAVSGPPHRPFIVWFFWLVKAKGVTAALTSAGYQEQMVLVKGGPARWVCSAGG